MHNFYSFLKPSQIKLDYKIRQISEHRICLNTSKSSTLGFYSDKENINKLCLLNVLLSAAFQNKILFLTPTNLYYYNIILHFISVPPFSDFPLEGIYSKKRWLPHSLSHFTTANGRDLLTFHIQHTSTVLFTGFTVFE